jgi:crossover junction endodeoxyribonuclease RusA
MSPVVELNVTGLPAPQGSHSAYVNKATGRAVIMHGSSNVGRAKLEAWRGAVSGEAKRWMAEHHTDASPWDSTTPLSVAIIFRLPEPKARPRHLLHERRPDLDKLIRSTLDGLTAAHIISDDSRVSILVTAKRWTAGDPPGAEIVVRAALEDDLEEVFECWAS